MGTCFATILTKNRDNLCDLLFASWGDITHKTSKKDHKGKTSS